MQQEKVRLMSVITCAFLGNAQLISIRGPKIKQLSSIFHFYIVSRQRAGMFLPGFRIGTGILLISVFHDLS